MSEAVEETKKTNFEEFMEEERLAARKSGPKAVSELNAFESAFANAAEEELFVSRFYKDYAQAYLVEYGQVAGGSRQIRMLAETTARAIWRMQYRPK